MSILKTLFVAVFLACSANAIAAELSTIEGVHREALRLVELRKLPPPLVAWTFAKANDSANKALFESQGSSESYASAFRETWALLLDENHSNTDTASASSRFGATVARREWLKSEAQLRAARAATHQSVNFAVDGSWRPTPAGYVSPLLPNWGVMDLFGTAPYGELSRGLVPPKWNSHVAIRELSEVIRWGGASSSVRTPEQSLIATFWAAGSGTVTPPGMWILIALEAMNQHQLSGEVGRELLTVVAKAMADAGTACWKLKFDTQVWRPVTAVQTLREPTWRPLLETPPFPSYVSGHSSFSGAAATVLREVLGDRYPVRVVSSSHPGITREFKSFDAAANEAGDSRIYGGIHYHSDNEDGLRLGARAACGVLKGSRLPNGCR